MYSTFFRLCWAEGQIHTNSGKSAQQRTLSRIDVPIPLVRRPDVDFEMKNPQ